MIQRRAYIQAHRVQCCTAAEIHLQSSAAPGAVGIAGLAAGAVWANVQ
jgi:hypothetical protein